MYPTTTQQLRLAAIREQVVVEAAIRWHRASSSGDIDRACDNLHAAVTAYLETLPDRQ